MHHLPADMGSRFHSLTVKDLLDAREAYHKHLMSVDDNILGTAIGRQRVKLFEDGKSRTFTNSRVTDDAAPCVLVFVKKWRDWKEFTGKKDDFVRYVPPLLYLADGRVVPTCVVELTSEERAPSADMSYFKHPTVGGGYALRTHEQGREHWGTMACLVTDGAATYGLTCRHVAGEDGRPIYSVVSQDPIGVSHPVHRGKKRFSAVYPDWPGAHVYLNVDAGLIKLHDLNRATAQVLGVKKMGAVLNAAPETITLDWIGQRVFGFGAASGRSEGELAALFFRYRAMGGFEYVADVLVSPIPGSSAPLHSAPGNSGQLWFLRDRGADRPMAMQWGGYQLAEEGKTWQFVLGTFMSTICRELDVDVVRNWNAGLFEYWGAGVHRALSSVVAGVVGDEALQGLLEVNANNMQRLAPLPDEWLYKKGVKRPQDDVNAEGSYHFTDMDQKAQSGPYKGKTLLKLWEDESRVTKEVFVDYVSGLPVEGRREPPRSTLAFRAAYIYQQMVGFAKKGMAAEFVGAAGVLAHYIEDSCCSLHLSYKHHGDPEADDFDQMKDKKQADLHGSYDWVQKHSEKDIIAELTKRLSDYHADPGDLKTPGDVARAIARTQRAVYAMFPPDEVIQIFRDGGYKFRWEDIRDKALAAMGEGMKLLAQILTAAWALGQGAENIPAEEVDPAEIEALAESPEFLPSTEDYDPAGEATPRAAPRARRPHKEKENGRATART